MKPKQILQSNFFFLFLTAFLFLSLWGCSTTYQQSSILTLQGPYQIPDLPKSELATIQIDRNWIQYEGRFALAINKKIALRENFSEHHTNVINDVFVVPGTHDIALLLITYNYPAGESKETQTTKCLSIEVKADSTYLLTAEYENDTDDELCFQLIDKNTWEVVSQPQTDTNVSFNYKDSDNHSIQFGGSYNF